MKKLFILLSFVFASVVGLSQGIQTGGIFLRVADSAAYVNSTYVTTSHSNNYADIWYSTTSQLFWKWNGSSYELLASGGGGGSGTVTSVGLTLGTSGTDVGVSGSPVTTSGSITLNLPSSSASNRGLLTSADWSTFNGKQATLVSGTNIKTVNSTTLLGSGDLDLIDDAIVNGEAKAPSQNATFDAFALKKDIANTAGALTDGGSIDITGTKHTLTTDEATITFSQSFTGDFANIDVTFNTTAATWTFPAGSLCVVEGAASGNNTATISAVSGDKIVISIWFVAASNYRIAIKNFGQ